MPTDCKLHALHQNQLEVGERRMNKQGEEIDRISNCLERLTALQEAQTIRDAEFREFSERRTAILETEVAQLKYAPGKKWDQVTMYALMAIVGAVVSYAITNIGF